MLSASQSYRCSGCGKNHSALQQSEFRHAGLVRGSGEEKQKVCGSVHILAFSTFCFFVFLNQKRFTGTDLHRPQPPSVTHVVNKQHKQDFFKLFF